MKLKNPVKANASPKMRRNGHRTRVAWEAKGVGLLSAKTWLFPSLNETAIKRVEKMAVTGTKPVFLHLHEANRGDLLVPVRLAADGIHFICGPKNAKMALDVFPPNSVKVLSEGTLIEGLLKSGKTAKVRCVSGAEIEGMVFGDCSKPYAELVHRVNGKLVLKDIETRRNVHNQKELVSLLATDKDAKRVTALVCHNKVLAVKAS
jgi:hypothetical protein